MPIPFPPLRPTDWELTLPNYPVVPNNWRATEKPELLGSIAEGASLRLSYENILDADALALLLLWRSTAGGLFPLASLPAQVAAGITSTALADRILNIAPLVWVVAEKPRQQSVKAGRSTVEIELLSELRLSAPLAITTLVPSAAITATALPPAATTVTVLVPSLAIAVAAPGSAATTAAQVPSAALTLQAFVPGVTPVTVLVPSVETTLEAFAPEVTGS